MPGQRRVFTPTAIEVIRGLAQQGKSSSEIADAIGSTAASVRVKCHHLDIKLRPGTRPRLAQSQPYHIREHKLVVHLRPSVYAALQRKAAQMQKSAAELSRLLLEAIVSSNIYDAVLDDRE
jgi:DNA-binding CsgD family transcriptional regulator